MEEWMIKARVLEMHLTRGKIGAVAVEPMSQPAAPPLEKLQPIGLGDLKPGKHHTGFALYGTLCAEAFKSQGVHTVLEDASERAVLLSLYNVAVSTSSNSSARQRFPVGMRVAIKEPLLKREKGGILVLRVDNFLNIERVLGVPDWAGDFPAPTDGDAAIAASLKLEGNRLFSCKDWSGAADAYTKCIVVSSNASDLMAVALSNRAEVMLRLGHPEQALVDASNALRIDASGVKSYCRKARALHSLHEYEMALACMRKAAEVSRDHTGGLIQQCEASVRQSKQGCFDIGAFLVGGRARERAPTCADYVGPVAVRKSVIAYPGRGLFATASVKAGDILLVTNALAIAYSDSPPSVQASSLEEDLVIKLMAAVACSRRSFQQLSSLMSCAKIPSLDLFRPNARCYSEVAAAEAARVDTDSIRKVVRENALGQFLAHRLDGMCNSADVIFNSKSCGLWVLPALINHSCCPNASRVEVGRALFVHAARDIGEGEEITLPYFDVLVPLVARHDMCARWGFQCQCRRCAAERGLAKPLRRINEHFAALHERAFREINAAAQAGDIPGPLPACATFAQLAVRLQAELPSAPAHEVWLRSSYALAHLAGFPSSDFFDDLMTKIPPWEDLVTSFHDTVPGHWRPLIMQCVEMMELRHYYEAAPAEQQKRDDGPLRVLREVAYKLCRSTFGNQRPEVYDALIVHAATLRPF